MSFKELSEVRLVSGVQVFIFTALPLHWLAIASTKSCLWSGYWAPTSVVGPWEHYSSWGFHCICKQIQREVRKVGMLLELRDPPADGQEEAVWFSRGSDSVCETDGKNFDLSKWTNLWRRNKTKSPYDHLSMESHSNLRQKGPLGVI